MTETTQCAYCGKTEEEIVLLRYREKGKEIVLTCLDCLKEER